MGLLSMNSSDFYSTFAKEGGRVGSGALGSGQGGVARCAP
ncbi:sulfate adenylyltransferase [Streptomyces lasalocidi]|uniref:Sulfate adenylyltransferase n=3 Tax=Streptomyces TaxID=1883 RepID=A0A4U5WRP8_STRLS|nr:sulfate adenylyltransferase [Streptomyces lasalocidi]